MSFVGTIALIIVAVLLALILYCAIAVNRPRTKEEEALRFKQDCEEFDKYIAEKNKKNLEKANKR